MHPVLPLGRGGSVMAKLVLIVRTKTQPGKRDDVYRLFEKHLASRVEDTDALEVFVWCADEMDANTFYIFEIYGDRTVQQANAEDPAYFAYLQEAQPLLASPPEVVTATPVWTKVLAD
jgi:quinol monooxygenase YgiN